MNKLTPREIVRELDRYIVGQDEAKKAVAVALRNRYRRAQLSEEMQDCFLWRLHNFLSLLGTCKRSKVPKPPSTLVIIHISILAIPRGITAHCDFAIHFVKDLGFKHLSISHTLHDPIVAVI